MCNYKQLSTEHSTNPHTANTVSKLWDSLDLSHFAMLLTYSVRRPTQNADANLMSHDKMTNAIVELYSVED